MQGLRVRRLLLFVIAIATATALTGAVAYATCGGGEGGKGGLEVSPDTWDGFYTGSKTFTVKNTGTVNITSLTISLISSGGLQITSKTCGSSLSAGASCSVTVKCLKQEEDAALSAIAHSPIAIDTSVLHCTLL